MNALPGRYKILAVALAALFLFACNLGKTTAPSPTGTPLPPTAAATTTATATATALPLPIHSIAIREVNGVGEFFDRRTGKTFVPRGFNYLHFAQQIMPWGEERYQDSTFATDQYDPDQVEAALQKMHAYGFNVVRVFLIDSTTGVVGNGSGLSPAYVDNLADFLERAARNEVFVWFTTDWLPGGRYGELSNRECCVRFGSTNLQIMTAGSVEAIGNFYADLHGALIARGAPVEYVFTYELRNEVYFDATAPPLSFKSGQVRAGNGRLYDMAVAGDRQRLMDESLVYYIDTARSIIQKADPTALVSVGFFVPQGPVRARVGDTRLIETRPAIWESTADFIDLHLYPGFELSLAGHVTNFGMEDMREKPIVMGEFGAFRSQFGSPSRSAQVLAGWQADSCAFGFDGWLLWHWDTAEDTALWNALSGEEGIARALAPSLHPDPCSP